MPLDKFIPLLRDELAKIDATGTAKAKERVVVEVHKGDGKRGPRFLLAGYGPTEFIRMNSNSYLGLSLDERLAKAEEAASARDGVGPGAVRFISGTYEEHVELERRLAAFHRREACMITSAAYTAVLGVIVSLVTTDTMILSDELNHNSIINAVRLARPKERKVYRHADVEDLEEQIVSAEGLCDALLVVTDGVFSMRGVYAPLKQIKESIALHTDRFPRGIVLIVDDSHGVGAFGRSGRGTEEETGAQGVDILVATLGKAFGVNGGYICSSKEVIQFLRERNPLYIYTNPITQGEAAAAMASLGILDSDEGRHRLDHLREMTQLFRHGLTSMGYETLESPHPIVPLMVRDTERTTEMVNYLFERGVLATGLNYPVVPKGDQLIRFQVNADHTRFDLEAVLAALKEYQRQYSRQPSR